MAETWQNWSGSIKFTPQQILEPENEEELAREVEKAAAENKKVRVYGAGHSSMPLVETPDLLVSVNNMKGLISHKEGQEATIYAGMKVKEAGEALYKVGLGLHNTGDVDVQNLSGAIGTGTHGTGLKLQNLSGMLLGAKLVTASGEIIEKHLEDDPEFIKALRVGLGTLGIFTQLRVKAQPAYKLLRQEYCTHVDTCLEHLQELKTQNRNFDFYWYPRSDLAKLRTMNEPGQGMENLPFAELVMRKEGLSHEVLARTRELKFEEMEYALPIEAGPECFQEVRQRIKKKHRAQVAWRTLYRTIAADDTYISPYYQRDSVTISLHHNAGLPFWDYFKDIEPIFRAYGGRPHWAKKHTLKANDVRDMYPKWEDFLKLRQQMDPKGVFLTPYLKELFGV